MKSAGILVAVGCLLRPLPASANSLDAEFLGQSPPNIVPEGVQPVFSLQTRNVDDGSSVESDGIGVGISLAVDGVLVRADSGEFTSTGCSVDASFPQYWACNPLPNTGSFQNISFTWFNPKPGLSGIIIAGYCQEIPVPSSGQPRFCDVNGNPWGSNIVVFPMFYIWDFPEIFDDGFEDTSPGD